jgi:hypothetical protein
VQYDLRPMLATLADKPFDDPAWIFETKWDGFAPSPWRGPATPCSVRAAYSFCGAPKWI